MRRKALARAGVVAIVAIVLVAAAAGAIYYFYAAQPRILGTKKLGVLLPLKLPVGDLSLKAVQMAVSEINEAGGLLRYNITVVSVDDSNDATAGKSGYARLVQEGVVAVIGPFGSHVALALLDDMALYKVPLISPAAVSTAIDAKVANNTAYKYWFRVYVNGTEQARLTWDFLSFYTKKLGLSKMAFIRENLPYTIPYLQYGAIRSQQEGITVFDYPFDPAQTQTFVPLISKAVADGADFIFPQFSLVEDPIFVRDYYTVAKPLPVVGGTVLMETEGFWNLTKGQAQGMITIIWGFPVPGKAADFYNKFKAKYGSEPFFTAYYAYDAVYVWAQAVKAANSFDADAVVAAMEKVRYDGVAGHYAFTRAHTAQAGPEGVPAYFIQWQDGKRIVIWPLNKVQAGTKLLVPTLRNGAIAWTPISWP